MCAWSAVWLLVKQLADQGVAVVCCQHHPPTHTSRLSHALERNITAAVPLVSHSTNEAEAVCGINIMRNMTPEHSKSKVCDPEAPRDCRSSRSALLPCALLTSTFGDEHARLTCRCSSVRRVSHERSFGASCPTCLDTAPTLAPSVGGCSSWRASSTARSSGCCGRRRPRSGGGYHIAGRLSMVLQPAGRSALVLERAVPRRSRHLAVVVALGGCVSASTDLRGL